MHFSLSFFFVVLQNYLLRDDTECPQLYSIVWIRGENSDVWKKAYMTLQGRKLYTLKKVNCIFFLRFYHTNLSEREKKKFRVLLIAYSSSSQERGRERASKNKKKYEVIFQHVNLNCYLNSERIEENNPRRVERSRAAHSKFTFLSH